MKKIAIISWWISLEREIALKSADFFKKYIEEDYDFYVFPEEMEKFISNKDEYKLVIPVFHWEYWEDWKIFAFLEILWLTHTFSNYDTHSLCLNKERTNVLMKDIWINIPFQYIIKNEKDFPENYPVIMKPNNWWSSFHTYKINSKEEFTESYKLTRKDLNDDILIQEFISGEEYSVPVIDWEVLPIMKLEKDNDFIFDYESKYENDEQIKETFPEIEKTLELKLQNDTKKIYKYLNLKSISRIDFLVKNNELYFLEVNTIPGMTEASILPKSRKLTWKNYFDLVKDIIK